IDSSPAMLAQAKKKLAGTNTIVKKTNLEEKLDFADEYFDRIVSVNTFYTIKNQAGCLKEFYRIIKTEGRLVISNPNDKYKLRAIFMAQLEELGWLKFIIKFLLNLPALSIVLFVNIFFIKKSRFNFLKEEELAKMLAETGFKILKSQLTYAGQNLLITALK
ncbi:MAG: methyltransferase domain-containing protein, partial [bacterium]|nr:methyltransferase domain-containing protein [bacterium]